MLSEVTSLHMWDKKGTCLQMFRSSLIISERCVKIFEYSDSEDCAKFWIFSYQILFCEKDNQRKSCDANQYL